MKAGMAPPLLFASDCSGIETPRVVLDRLQLQHRHVFSSDLDARCREYIAAHHPPETVYRSVFDRPLQSEEQIDLYVAGPPCTAASGLNCNQPEELRDAAYNVGRNCFDFIQQSRPHCFVIENVPRLRTVRNGAVFADLLARVPDIYDVGYQSLNARNYGCPQNRNRMYIVGVRQDNPHGWAVRYPERVPLDVSAADLLVPELSGPELAPREREHVRAHIPPGSDYVVNIQSAKMQFRMSGACIPKDKRCASCLTHHDPKMYSARLDRALHTLEHARLQGFRDGEVDVEHRGMRNMLGNAMNATVLEHLLRAITGVTP